MGRRLMNIASVLLGSLGTFLSVRDLMNHQYSFLRYSFYTDDPKRWTPTVVSLFTAIWLFVFGLVGLIDERRKMKPKPG
jgi:hypothetical protein